MRALLLLMLLPLAAFADEDCAIGLLPPGMAAFRQATANDLDPLNQRDQPYSQLEYEVLMDVLHDAVVRIQFHNGHTIVTFKGEDDYAQLRAYLNELHIVGAAWVPAQDEEYRRLILKPACLTLGLAGCDGYDHDYPDPSVRPFTRLQELALKWAVMHTAPPRQNYKLMKQAADHQGMDFPQLWDVALVAFKEHATRMLYDTFPRAQARRLNAEFVEPMLEAGFENRMRREERIRNN